MPAPFPAPDAPAILMVAFEDGRCGPARLPRPLAAAGFRVSALCPADNVLAATCHLDRHFPLEDVRSAHRVATRLAAAMAATRPVLVVPCDERAVACLQAIVRTAGYGAGPCGLDAGMIATLTDSLGDPCFFDALLMKSETLALARRIGLDTPGSIPVTDAATARAAAERLGWPVYLKSSFGWAGQGVIACHTPAEIDAAMARLTPRRSPLRALARRLLHRDWYPVDSQIDVQQAIDGRPAMVAAVAWRGEMLASFAGVTRESLSATGPGSVIGLSGHAGMEAAAACFIAATGASGFISFDFLLSGQTGRAFLLECNPRPIQIGHLGERIGVDLAVALAAGLRGGARPEAHATGTAEIALFPNGRRHARPGVPLDLPEDDDRLTAAMLRIAVA